MARRAESSTDKLLEARETALKALAGRDLTASEVRDLLIRRRFPAAVVQAAVIELEGLRVIDDERVVRQYAQRRLEERVAGALLRAELLERGVEEGVIEGVLAEAMTDRDEEADALELARDLVRRSPARLTPDAVRRRVFAALARRGFDQDIAREAVERAAEEYLGRP
jgi:regulatory protein